MPRSCSAPSRTERPRASAADRLAKWRRHARGAANVGWNADRRGTEIDPVESCPADPQERAESDDRGDDAADRERHSDAEGRREPAHQRPTDGRGAREDGGVDAHHAATKTVG